MIELIMLAGGLSCMCAIIVIAFIILSRAEQAVNKDLAQESAQLTKLVKGESYDDIIESGMIQGLYPGAAVTTSKNTSQAPPNPGFLLLQDNSGTITSVKGSGTLKVPK